MQELRKRITAGWVLMDHYQKSNGHAVYVLERANTRRYLDISQNGHLCSVTSSKS